MRSKRVVCVPRISENFGNLDKIPSAKMTSGFLLVHKVDVLAVAIRTIKNIQGQATKETKKYRSRTPERIQGNRCT
jgi:hypothetical protein